VPIKLGLAALARPPLPTPGRRAPSIRPWLRHPPIATRSAFNAGNSSPRVARSAWSSTNPVLRVLREMAGTNGDQPIMANLRTPTSILVFLSIGGCAGETRPVTPQGPTCVWQARNPARSSVRVLVCTPAPPPPTVSSDSDSGDDSGDDDMMMMSD